MKKEYKKPVVEAIGVILSAPMLTTSLLPGEGSISPDDPGIDDGGAAKEISDEIYPDFDDSYSETRWRNY